MRPNKGLAAEKFLTLVLDQAEVGDQMTAERGKIGHNGGPELASLGWRRPCWQEARARLLPVLPIEVVRTRVRRAAELGLDYKTYAGVRATTGHDLVAFLFSSNALRVSPIGVIPASEAARLAGLRCLGARAFGPGFADRRRPVGGSVGSLGPAGGRPARRALFRLSRP